MELLALAKVSVHPTFARVKPPSTLELTVINWHSYGVSSAVQDFKEARRRAALEEMMARLTGKSAELLSYEDVRQKLRATGSTPRGVREIPLDAIVGSVGRCTDFTRSFLPRQDSDLGRWAGVESAAPDPASLPAIDVYQVGEAYFVLDGNHRVSVARQKGMRYISAHVTEVHTRVPLSSNAEPDELVIKAEAAAFLEYTHLDEVCSGAELMVSVPGQYARLENHIEVFRYFVKEELGHELSIEEAACRWYSEAYRPAADLIREQGILRDFPGRTETDLFLWLSDHRVAIRKELGLDLKPESAVTELVEHFSPKPERVAARWGRKLIEVVTPDTLTAGPPPGQWRAGQVAARHECCLFADVLAAINGEESGWLALGVALQIARRENGVVHGFHAAPSEAQLSGDKARAVQAEFDRRCREAGISGELSFDVGEVARAIYERSWWVDLIVLSLSYPPAPQPIARLASGLHTLLRNCARPVLAVPGPVCMPSRVLLAYDGSPRAEEALFVATYLAGQWEMPLVVVTAKDGRAKAEAPMHAQEYLEAHDVRAMVEIKPGPAAEAILRTADERECDWIIMGSYGPNPLVEMVKGSAVDAVLRASKKPVLICR